MIRLAKKQALKSNCRCRHGAAITKGSNVVGVGHNTYKTHATLGGGILKTLHAEASAIRDAFSRGVDLRGAILYVARVSENSKMSKPCPACQKKIEEAGIKKVVYTNELGNLEIIGV